MRLLAFVVGALLLTAPGWAQQNRLAAGFSQARWGDCAPTNLTRQQAEFALSLAPMSDRVRERLFGSTPDLIPIKYCAQQAHAQICTRDIVAVLKQAHIAVGMRGLSGGQQGVEEKLNDAKDLFEALEILLGRAPTARPSVGAIVGGTAGALMGGIAGSNHGFAGLGIGGELGRRGGAAAGDALMPGLAAAQCTRRLAAMEQTSEQLRGAPAQRSASAVLLWIGQQSVDPSFRQGLSDLRDAAKSMSQSAPQLQAMLAR